MAPKTGDRVRVVARDVTAEDTKSGLYYLYFGGLSGAVDRVYDDGTVCVDIELDSLTEEMRNRHVGIQESERKRWLDGLSEEMRNRLTAEQKQLKMNYRILVLAKDLEALKDGKPTGFTKDSSAKSSAAETGEKKAAPRAPTPSPAPAAQAAQEPAVPEDEPTEDKASPKRLSEADLAAAEEAFLRSRQSSP